MKLKWTKLSLMIFTALFINTAAFSADKDKDSIKKAEENFYLALNQMFRGAIEPMKALWSHASDVTYMGPGGEFNIGWGKVLKTWETQAAMKLGGKVEPENTHFIIGNNIAIASCVEKGENKNAQGQVQKVSIRATNVFRKEEGQWKMIVHHTDLLPYLVNELPQDKKGSR